MKAGRKGNLNVATEVCYMRLDIQESVGDGLLNQCVFCLYGVTTSRYSK